METFRKKLINNKIDKKNFAGFQNKWKKKGNLNRLKKLKTIIT